MTTQQIIEALKRHELAHKTVELEEYVKAVKSINERAQNIENAKNEIIRLQDFILNETKAIEETRSTLQK